MKQALVRWFYGPRDMRPELASFYPWSSAVIALQWASLLFDLIGLFTGAALPWWQTPLVAVGIAVHTWGRMYARRVRS